MRKIQELHEEIDEVNYFLREWQRLLVSNDQTNKIIQKPEIRFVSHAIERVIQSAYNLDIPLVLKTGSKPILAKRARKKSQHNSAPNFNWYIPSCATIQLTNYRKLSTEKSGLLTFVGNEKGLMSLRNLAEAVSHGGELRISGKHAGDWSA
ncbi:MAG: hypothetical protein QG628_714 [Patescibacteria group bacterium]|nr:hypothetical protein [Patescibacteria group bacterium]